MAKGLLCLHDGNLNQALEQAEQALARARPVDQLIEARVILADIHRSLGQLREAESQCAQATVTASRLASPRLLCITHLGMAKVAAELDRRGANRSFGAA